MRAIVIGSGPVGSAFARRLLEGSPAVEVTMFERGPVVSDPAGMNVRNIVDPDEKLRARRASQGPKSGEGEAVGLGIPITTVIEGTYTARAGTHLIDFGGPGSGHSREFPAAAVATCVGGQGAHWTCATPRPQFGERIPFIPSDEWDELVERAEAVLHTTHTAFDGSAIAAGLQDAVSEAVDADLPKGYGVSPLPVAGDLQPDGSMRWTGTDTVLGPLIDPESEVSTRFSLRPETAVTRIVTEGGRVTGVMTRHRDEPEEFVPADLVIAAADALRTPQLLWASGIRPPALGHYLSDHPGVFSVVAIDGDKLEGRLTLEQIAQERARMAAAGTSDPVAAVLRVPYSEPDHPYSSQILYMYESPLPIPEDHPLHGNPWGYANVGFGVRKFARYEDCVTYDDDELDYAGMPNMTVHYELTEREQAELAGARKSQARVASAIGTFIPGGEPAVMPNGASLHYKGTMRMGAADDGGSVCDAWSRVWGFENLYLAGNGVIPTNTVVNPTLMSVALALRAADQILEEQ